MFASKLWESIAFPPSCTTGAGTSGVPSFARRGLTARVCIAHTEGRESRPARCRAGGERESQRDRAKLAQSRTEAEKFEDDRELLVRSAQAEA